MINRCGRSGVVKTFDPYSLKKYLIDSKTGNGMLTPINRFIFDEDGATSIEYALIAMLISVVIIAAVQAMTGEIGLLFTQIETKLSTAITKA
jgi:pilus assembly protein Flp/PilA